MLTTGFGDFADDRVDPFPPAHRSEIDEPNARLYEHLNNGVYMAGFSTDQAVDYPDQWPYVRDLYQRPGSAETVRFDVIRAHYYGTHPVINPRGMRAVRPDADFEARDRREALSGASETGASGRFGA